MEIKLYNPTQPQKDFLNIIYEDKPFITLAAMGRQTGKTYAMMNDAEMRALNNNKHRMFWVSPIQDQANKVMKDIESMFSNHQDLFSQIITGLIGSTMRYTSTTVVLSSSVPLKRGITFVVLHWILSILMRVLLSKRHLSMRCCCLWLQGLMAG